jgi:RPM1-interacting protein 4
MARRSQVPQFGDWESEANLSYTEYFEKASKNNSGVKKNPNESRENPSQREESRVVKGPSKDKPKHQRQMSYEDEELKIHASPSVDSPMHEAEARGSNGQDSVKPRLDHQKDVDSKRPPDSPLTNNTVGQRLGSTDSPLHRNGGVSNDESPQRVPKQSADRSFERSPFHPHHQSKHGHKGGGVSSPSSERRGSSEGGNQSFAPSTPVRSRLASVNRGDESPDHGTAVPKFGDWDEGNPAPAVPYTQIFEKVREEKLDAEAGGVPSNGTPKSYFSNHRQNKKESSKRCGCFPW